MTNPSTSYIVQKFTAKDKEMAKSYGFILIIYLDNLLLSTNEDLNENKYRVSLKFVEDYSSNIPWIKLPPGFNSLEEVLIHATLEELTAPP
jgi:hypothetical protein